MSFEEITFIDFKKFKSQPSEIKFRIINSVVKKRSNSYYPPRSKKVFNLIEDFKPIGSKSAPWVDVF